MPKMNSAAQLISTDEVLERVRAVDAAFKQTDEIGELSYDDGKFYIGDYLLEGRIPISQVRWMVNGDANEKVSLPEMNAALQSRVGKIRLNIFKNRVVGVVSSRYNVLPTAEILERMSGIGWTAGVAVADVRGRVDFWLVLGDRPPVVGSTQLMLRGYNGVDGATRFKIEMGLMRLVCSNGLTIKTLGTSVSAVHSVDRGSMDQLEEMIDQAQSIGPLVIRASMRRKIDVYAALERMRGMNNLPPGPMNRAATFVTEGRGGIGTDEEVRGATTTEWGLVQTLAAVGRGYSATVRTKLESAAGTILVSGFGNFIREYEAAEEGGEA